MPNGILEVKQIKQLSADGGETVVDVENKTIDDVAIGGTTPAAGSFTDMAFNSGYGSVATAYGCRAWVNFRGTSQSGTLNSSGPTSGQYTATVTGATTFTIEYSSTTYTVTTSGNHEIGDGEGVDLTISGTSVTIDTQIRASGNVSSITDNGTGDYTVNFTTAMPDENYAVAVSSNRSGAGPDPNWSANLHGTSPMASGSVRIAMGTPSTFNPADSPFCTVSIFR